MLLKPVCIARVASDTPIAILFARSILSATLPASNAASLIFELTPVNVPNKFCVVPKFALKFAANAAELPIVPPVAS